MTRRLRFPAPVTAGVLMAAGWGLACLISGHWLIREIWFSLPGWALFCAGYTAGRYRPGE